MKLYIDRVQHDAYPFLKWMDGALMRLFGMNVHIQEPNDIYVEPVYLPFILITRQGGQLIIEIRPFWDHRCFALILMLVKPYVWTSWSGGIVLQGDND